jgi:hypothetical protein
MLFREYYSIWRYLFVAAYCLPVMQATADESGKQTEDNPRKTLVDEIKAVKAAVIHYRYVFREAKPNQDRDVVVRLVNAANLVGNEDAQKKLITSLDPTFAGQATVWCSNVFKLRGRDNRVDSTYEGRTTTHVLAGNIELLSSPITPQGKYQTDVWDRGASHIRIDSLRDLCGMSSPGEEVFRFGETTFKKEVTLPAVIVRTRYVSGKLKTFSVTMIDKAESFEEMPDQAFYISGKPNDIFVDWRSKPHDVTTIHVPLINVLNATVQPKP